MGKKGGKGMMGNAMYGNGMGGMGGMGRDLRFFRGMCLACFRSHWNPFDMATRC